MGISGRSSVSVIAPYGMQADALATAVSVLGAGKGIELVKRTKGAELLMVVEDDDGGQRTVKSSGFAAFADPAP